MIQHVTKYAITIDDPVRIRYHLEKAASLAVNGRPGPVWIDIPLDVQALQIDPTALEGFTPPNRIRRFTTRASIDSSPKLSRH